ncbi:hypothetical protein [Bradyrhizobium sp. ISRA463]|uniref:hypothetical protein n=1 Tax=Bradyrhizobium sp. ISRA463 TaxID=2866199 RepID=UPI00247836F7|nr:hypothetical protein [Bradyrhizobium sp. ISRA463]WGS19176.1 hypothetical protein MTX22_32735 [Bradyrhizobium sp. ISRA463]
MRRSGLLKTSRAGQSHPCDFARSSSLDKYIQSQRRACVLILQDTTEFTYSRESPGKIGYTKTINAGRYKAGQPTACNLCGVLMHSSLVVTTSGTPLGLSAVKLWTRSKFKATAALRRLLNQTRVPIETKESYCWLENLRQSIALLGSPERCVHIGDRESDIYELFCLAQVLGARFLVRVQTNRLAEPPSSPSPTNAAHRVFAQLAAVPWSGRHRVATGGQDGETAFLQIKFASVKTLPPIGKQSATRYKRSSIFMFWMSIRLRIVTRSTGSS